MANSFLISSSYLRIYLRLTKYEGDYPKFFFLNQSKGYGYYLGPNFLFYNRNNYNYEYLKKIFSYFQVYYLQY